MIQNVSSRIRFLVDVCFVPRALLWTEIHPLYQQIFYVVQMFQHDTTHHRFFGTAAVDSCASIIPRFGMKTERWSQFFSVCFFTSVYASGWCRGVTATLNTTGSLGVIFQPGD